MVVAAAPANVATITAAASTTTTMNGTGLPSSMVSTVGMQGIQSGGSLSTTLERLPGSVGPIDQAQTISHYLAQAQAQVISEISQKITRATPNPIHADE